MTQTQDKHWKRSTVPPRELVYAVMEGDADAFETVIREEGARVLAARMSRGDSVIGLCLNHRRPDFAVRAVELGADPDAVLRARRAMVSKPLHEAARLGHLALVEALITAGAALDALDSSGVPPVSIAIDAGHRVVLERLLAAGANPNEAAVTREDGPLVGGRLGAVLPLGRAARAGDGAMVSLLRRAGAEPDARDPEGFTELDRAVLRARWAPECERGCCLLLVEAGADPHLSHGLRSSPVETLRQDRHEALASELEAAARTYRLGSRGSEAGRGAVGVETVGPSL